MKGTDGGELEEEARLKKLAEDFNQTILEQGICMGF
jgi:hypothetical protein